MAIAKSSNIQKTRDIGSALAGSQFELVHGVRTLKRETINNQIVCTVMMVLVVKHEGDKLIEIIKTAYTELSPLSPDQLYEKANQRYQIDLKEIQDCCNKKMYYP